ncbi:MAG: DUF3024 domain-containing protein [Actinomycetes bacterium]
MTTGDIPETDLARIRKWCASRVTGEASKQVRVVGVVEGRRVVIAEERPPWNGDDGAPWESYPLARLTYVTTSRSWRLEVSADGDRFRKYPELPSGSLDEVLGEIDEDPTFAFWG